jgi:hypothetical protein
MEMTDIEIKGQKASELTVDLKDTLRIENLVNKTYLLDDRSIVQYKYIGRKSEKIGVVAMLLVRDLDISHPAYRRVVETALAYVAAGASVATRKNVPEQAFMETSLTLRSLITALAAAHLLQSTGAHLLVTEIEQLEQYVADTDSLIKTRRRPDLAHALNEPIPVVESPQDAIEHERVSAPSTTQVLSEQMSHTSVQKDKKVPLRTTSRKRKKDRRASILTFMQQHESVSIKDVSDFLTDCSEKTIQRELLALVMQGILVKKGERRWSTYSLA